MKGLIIMETTGTRTVTRGAKVKKLDPSSAGQTISRIIAFLRMFVAATIARRMVSAVLLAVGVPDAQAAELTGMSERSLRDLRKKLRDGATDDDLFKASGGGGRERKLKEVEQLVTKKIESNDYHTHQEIADMIYGEHGIRVHRSTVLRMLKKTASGA